jgi:hypothetical protein
MTSGKKIPPAVTLGMVIFISSVYIPMLEPSFKDKKPWDKKIKGHHEGRES